MTERFQSDTSDTKAGRAFVQRKDESETSLHAIRLYLANAVYDLSLFGKHRRQLLRGLLLMAACMLCAYPSYAQSAASHPWTSAQSDLRLRLPAVARHLASDGRARPPDSNATPTELEAKLVPLKMTAYTTSPCNMILLDVCTWTLSAALGVCRE